MGASHRWKFWPILKRKLLLILSIASVVLEVFHANWELLLVERVCSHQWNERQILARQRNVAFSIPVSHFVAYTVNIFQELKDLPLRNYFLCMTSVAYINFGTLKFWNFLAQITSTWPVVAIITETVKNLYFIVQEDILVTDWLKVCYMCNSVLHRKNNTVNSLYTNI